MYKEFSEYIKCGRELKVIFRNETMKAHDDVAYGELQEITDNGFLKLKDLRTGDTRLVKASEVISVSPRSRRY
jgi:hypothetical protein